VPGHQPPQTPQPTRVQPAFADPEPYDQFAEPGDEPDEDDEPVDYRPPRRSSGRGRRSRYPDDGYDDYDADPDDRPEPEPRRRRSPRGEQGGGGLPLPSAATVGRLIQLATGLIALAFVLHVIFVVAGADQANGFVSFTYSVAKTFV